MGGYEPWLNDLQDTSVMRDAVDPPGMSHNIDKTRFNSVRMVVQCGQKPMVGTQISVI